MVITMFTGWTGRPLSAPVASHAAWPRAVPVDNGGADITCSLRLGLAGTIALTTASPEVTARKTVYPDGRIALEIGRGCDRLTLATTDMSITIVRAHFTAVVHVNAASEDDLVRFREPLVASGAVRWLRALVAAIEEIGQPSLEHLAVRLAGALIAQFDGDGGAIPRLCRELQASYSRRSRQHDGGTAPHRAAFRRAVLRAARQMASGMAAYNHWHPARYGCAFTWLSQVEAAWHACVLADPTAIPHGPPAKLRRSRVSRPDSR